MSFRAFKDDLCILRASHCAVELKFRDLGRWGSHRCADSFGMVWSFGSLIAALILAQDLSWPSAQNDASTSQGLEQRVREDGNVESSRFVLESGWPPSV